MFLGRSDFNEDVSKWNVSNATSMIGMFSGASSFYQDISRWGVSSATNVTNMFTDATLMLSNYPVLSTASGVYTYLAPPYKPLTNTQLQDAVEYYIEFTYYRNTIALPGGENNTAASVKKIQTWDVSSITDMKDLFLGKIHFDGDISQWNVSNVITMENMFYNTPFNQDISQWNVSKVQNMSSMFKGAYKFNANISNWNVSNVYYMNHMFQAATVFNQSLANWNVSNVVNMFQMFEAAEAFYQNISDWNISNISDDNNLDDMFGRAYAMLTRYPQLATITGIKSWFGY